MSRRIVAVTGANRGLGYALVKHLLLESTMYDTVVLCSRDRQKGVEAYGNLRPFFKHPRHLEIADLDTSRPESVQRFSDWLLQQTGPLHAIVHNAGVMVKDPQASLEEKVTRTAQTNLFGVMGLTEELLSRDLLERGGKILNVSSKLGSPSFIRNPDLKERIKNIASFQDIRSLYQWQLDEARSGNLPNNFSPNFPFQEYSFQKLLLTKYTKLLAADSRVVEKGLEVYALCPGWCKTDMGGEMATETIESGTNISFQLLHNRDGLQPKLQGKLVIKPTLAMDI